MEEVECVFLTLTVPVFHRGTAIHIFHADVFGGFPLEQELVGLDVDFLEPSILDPAFLAKTQIRTIRFVLLVDDDKCSAFWRDAELMRISLETMALRCDFIGDFIRRVELEKSVNHKFTDNSEWDRHTITKDFLDFLTFPFFFVLFIVLVQKVR